MRASRRASGAPKQRCTPWPKARVFAAAGAGDVELLGGIAVPAGVAAGGAERGQDRLALADGDPVDVDVSDRVPQRHVRDRGSPSPGT
jgi:hypothetical protein